MNVPCPHCGVEISPASLLSKQHKHHRAMSPEHKAKVTENLKKARARLVERPELRKHYKDG
jgi:hypothetical protein